MTVSLTINNTDLKGEESTFASFTSAMSLTIKGRIDAYCSEGDRRRQDYRTTAMGLTTFPASWANKNIRAA